MVGKSVPRAVYRLQLNREFTFADAKTIVPYLHDLGISHLYVSPCLKPKAGSQHGYDIVDHGRLNPELGGSEAFAELVDVLHAHDMGLLLDIVPNHMGIDNNENVWWLDVLENGLASPYANYFDIDWHPIRKSLRGKILLPILADHYGTVLEAGKLTLEFDKKRGEFRLRYTDRRLPLDPETYPIILGHRIERFTALAEAETHTTIEWHNLITDFEQLRKLRTVTNERLRSAAACKRRLATLYRDSPGTRIYLNETLSLFNGIAGQASTFDQLHRLLELQSFRLAYWQVASDEINYRRFFDINQLVCLRQENPEVFALSHQLIFALIADRSVNGLRIDHVDGLWNPAAYCARLQQEARRIASPELEESQAPLYLVVEKILAEYEHLRNDWPVDGTTGYEFANQVNGLFVYAESEHEMSRIYTRFIGRQSDFDEVLYDRKRQVIRSQMSSQLTTLVNLLGRIAEAERSTRDYTLNGLREALIEVVVYFPVYRTYITTDDIAEEDRRFVDWAVAQAKKRSPATDITIFDFIRDVLLLKSLEKRGPENAGRIKQFVMKFQQYTAPVMAKGMEDTSFYVYNRLVSLNEVGGNPKRFGTSIAAFHHANQQRFKQWPNSLITLATHDSKRSGDVRSRINVLSERAQEWRRHLSRWRRLNRSKKISLDGLSAPSANAEYLFYQTLLGTFPSTFSDAKVRASYAERIKAYLLKAVREAKVHTSWINPNQAYEQAVADFASALLNPKKTSAFLQDFIAFQTEIRRFGYYNSLSQTLLLLTSPGVPDIYQGTELWHYTLVDPDNRRPVDFTVHRQYLNDFLQPQNGAMPQKLLEDIEDGRLKLFVIWKTLSLRKAVPELFSRGEYQALEVIGDKAEHVCAFLRRHGDVTALVIAGRWFARLEANRASHCFAWCDTKILIPAEMKGAVFRNVFSETAIKPETDDTTIYLPVAEMFKPLPIALLLLETNASQ